jgi:transcriptional regulator with XRE-family HTH domain
MEWQFRINWQALVEEAKQRRKEQKLTQAKLAKLAAVSSPTISRFESGETDIQLPTVLSIFSVLGMMDQRRLEFLNPCAFYDTKRMVVAFTGMDRGKTVFCAISKEALDDHFSGDRRNPIKVFTANQNRIEHKARRKYLAENLESDGSILVKTQDIDI